MSWNEAWGTYANSGATYDVAMVGGNGSVLGFPTERAIKESNHGRGVQFTSLNNEGTSVKIDLSLIGISIKNGQWVGNRPTGYASPNGDITATGYDYGWFVSVWYSTDGGNSYQDLLSNVKVATHYTPMALAYNDRTDIQSWKDANIEWSSTVSLPSNFTHLKFEVRGDDPAQRHQNVYSRVIVIPPPQEIKPWAIRKSGVFKTLNRDSGFFKIRHQGSWVDKSKSLISDINKKDYGTHRIRKNGVWVGQNKIGE